MHTEDMQDVIVAARRSRIVTSEQAAEFMAVYHELRDEKEAEAKARADKALRHSWFERVLLWPIPGLGVPAIFVGLIAWAIIAAVTR